MITGRSASQPDRAKHIDGLNKMHSSTCTTEVDSCVCENGVHLTVGQTCCRLGAPLGISMLPVLHMETNDTNERLFCSRFALSICRSLPTLRLGGGPPAMLGVLRMSVIFADTGIKPVAAPGSEV